MKICKARGKALGHDGLGGCGHSLATRDTNDDLVVNDILVMNDVMVASDNLVAGDNLVANDDLVMKRDIEQLVRQREALRNCCLKC